MSELKIGAALPILGSAVERLGPGGVGAAARHAEELGLDSVWVPDVVVGDGSPALDPIVALTAAAAVTTRVQVGFSVLVLPLRPVARTAAQVATLQQVSGDRVLLGVGSGGFPGTPFWRAAGGPVRGRGRETDAALDVLRQLIAGKPTRLEHQAEQPVVTLAPPVAVPPILVGGFRDSPAALRRAAAYGDAWFPSLLTPEGLAVGAAKLPDLAAEQGRATPRVAFGGHVVLGTDQAARAARDTVVRSMVDAHGLAPEEAAKIPVTGSPHQAAERFAAYAAAGADHFVVAPTNGDWMRQAELVAQARDLLGGP